MTSLDIALLTAAPYVAPKPDDWYISQIHHEEGLLANALQARGFSVERINWADPQIKWEAIGCAVLRSTWDYFDRFPEFQAWLNGPARQTRLINAAAVISWNMDKHYLADLANAGVEVVPTRFVEPGNSVSLATIASTEGWDEFVIKPAVSGAARLTFRCTAADAGTLQPLFEECVARESMLIQPFQPEIVSAGEISLIVIDGVFTHAIRKVAKPGDFRVQDDHGGKVLPHTATPEQIRFAEKAVTACPSLPVYARVDLVDTPQGCRLMELELIEPELFLRFHPPAADSLADAIAARQTAARTAPQASSRPAF